MAAVDPENDAIRRHVVYHYRYDPERHERRNVPVAGFDNLKEFDAFISKLAADLDRRRREDPAFDQRESVSGITFEPGDRKRAANAHLIEKMVRHGVWNPELAAGLQLPGNMAIMSADSDVTDDQIGSSATDPAD